MTTLAPSLTPHRPELCSEIVRHPDAAVRGRMAEVNALMDGDA